MFQKFIDKYRLKAIDQFRDLDGWLTENEALGLYSVASKLPGNSTVVEIGSWQGKNTYCISKGLRSGKIYAIESFNADGGFDVESEKLYLQKRGDTDLLENFKKNMQQLRVLKKIIIKKGYSYQFHEDFNKLNFLFIDGDHSIEGCKPDFDLYSSKIVPGGYIAFHDYYEERGELGPTYVIKNLVLKSKKFKFFKQSDTLWVANKIA
jgi:hypothetical protein